MGHSSFLFIFFFELDIQFVHVMHVSMCKVNLYMYIHKLFDSIISSTLEMNNAEAIVGVFGQLIELRR